MKITNKADFAKKLNISKPAVSNLTKVGGKLSKAINSDGHIILDHPDTLSYLARRSPANAVLQTLGLNQSMLDKHKPVKKTRKAAPAKKAQPKPESKIVAAVNRQKKIKKNPKESKPNPDDAGDAEGDPDDAQIGFLANREIDEDVNLYLDMTLRSIIERFGTDSQFKNILDARKHIEDIKTKEFNNKIKSGEYIPREMVERFIFPFIDNAYRRLVEDLPGTLSRQVKSKILSEAPDEEVSVFIRDSISKTLKGIKENAIRILK